MIEETGGGAAQAAPKGNGGGVLDAEYEQALDVALVAARHWLASTDQRLVRPSADAATMLRAFDEELPLKGEPAEVVIETLAQRAEPGLMATGSGRFFGWVIGGALPASLGADWLVGAWDQNAALPDPFPAVCAIEQIAARWILEALALPAGCSVGFVTGGQMANTICLAAARNHVLSAVGWDVETGGLNGGPPLRVVAGEERHDTVDRALRLLGVGTRSLHLLPVDDAGRVRPQVLHEILAGPPEPTIVCLQAGNVNGGATDPVGTICDIVDGTGREDIWVHVDGAFGLWARADPSRRHLLDGVERADSWATDAHKWLNTPYDCGMAICAHPTAHRAALHVDAAYLPAGQASPLRHPMDFSPEFSRRARSVPVWAALRQLGRDGLARLVDRCCEMAERFAGVLGAAEGVVVMQQNLNQVVVRFEAPGGGDGDAHTREVVRKVQDQGTCYPSATVWQGAAAMRISVSNWRTDSDDVDRSVAAILAAHSGFLV